MNDPIGTGMMAEQDDPLPVCRAGELDEPGEDTPWLVEPLWRRAAVAGPPKLGKTWLGLGLALSVRTSPYYSQSNGKMEAWSKTVKMETIRPACPATLAEVLGLVGRHVEYDNQVHLRSAVGWVAPAHRPAGREASISR